MPEDIQTRTGSAVPQFLLAVIFLAILGGAGGVLAGTAARHHDQALAGTGTQGSRGGGGPTVGDPLGGGPGTGQLGTGSTTSSDSCPRPTVEMARAGVLSLVFYLRTTGSEVWICKDAQNRLYYQGHRGAPNDTPLIEGSNALFLTDVRTEGTGWVAANHQAADGSTVEYHVSAQSLIIRHLPASGSPVPDQSEMAVH